MIGTDLAGLFIAFVAGAAMGAGYFAGLWLTVCRLSSTQSPYRFYGSSLLLRMTLVLAGFYLLAAKGYENVLVAGVGFMVSRQLWLLAKRSQTAKQVQNDNQDA